MYLLFIYLNITYYITYYYALTPYFVESGSECCRWCPCPVLMCSSLAPPIPPRRGQRGSVRLTTIILLFYAPACFGWREQTPMQRPFSLNPDAAFGGDDG